MISAAENQVRSISKWSTCLLADYSWDGKMSILSTSPLKSRLRSSSSNPPIFSKSFILSITVRLRSVTPKQLSGETYEGGSYVMESH